MTSEAEWPMRDADEPEERAGDDGSEPVSKDENSSSTTRDVATEAAGYALFEVVVRGVGLVGRGVAALVAAVTSS